jgi:hypothetical protein
MAECAAPATKRAITRSPPATKTGVCFLAVGRADIAVAIMSTPPRPISHVKPPSSYSHGRDQKKRDRKFALQADRVFQSLGARVILTPLMAPRANAHAERWIGSCRRERLDWMLIVNQRHLQAVVDEYRLHYNGERPHRSPNLRPPASRGDSIQTAGSQIERGTRLGGLLSDYRRVPAAA